MIMNLSFPEALKYAFLGDAIYRLEHGRAGQRTLEETDQDYITFVPRLNAAHRFQGEETFSASDLLANDWIAEGTEYSV